MRLIHGYNWRNQKRLFKKMSDTQILNWLVDQLETYVWTNDQDIIGFY